MDKYIVCYLDLLGATEAIKNDDGTVFNLVKNIYENANKVFRKYAKNEFELDIKAFSDNIVLSRKIDKSMKESMQILYFIVSISVMLSGALKKNLLLRGGITIGEFYIDTTMVWGKALVKAYNLENKVAIYPRVIIDDAVIKRLIELNRDDEELFGASMIKVDKDGRYFVDYLQENKEDKVAKRNDIIENEFAYITKYFSKHITVGESIRSKFLWLLLYMRQYYSPEGLDDFLEEEFCIKNLSI